MHELVLKLFGFLRSCIQFFKVVIFFCLMMLTLYWIQNLLGSYWAWMDFIAPLLSFFVGIGEKISSDSLMLFDAVFEYKYAIAGLLFGVIFVLINLLRNFINTLEEWYLDGRRFVKKAQENQFNAKLEKNIVNEQTKIRRYYVYASAIIKKKYDNKNFNINLEQQIKEMIKFISSKTAVFPQKFEEGYLYTFENFEDVDTVLEVLFKVLSAQTPLDYNICVQVVSNASGKEKEQVKTLKNLQIHNKIIFMADTKYRYGFNKKQNCKTTQVGVFQNNGESFEVYEFFK